MQVSVVTGSSGEGHVRCFVVTPDFTTPDGERGLDWNKPTTAVTEARALDSISFLEPCLGMSSRCCSRIVPTSVDALRHGNELGEGGRVYAMTTVCIVGMAGGLRFPSRPSRPSPFTSQSRRSCPTTPFLRTTKHAADRLEFSTAREGNAPRSYGLRPRRVLFVWVFLLLIAFLRYHLR